MTVPSAPRPIRVCIPCAGESRRAAEVFASECADALRDEARVQITILANRSTRTPSAAWFLPRIIARRPDIVYCADATLLRICHSWRRVTGQRLRLLYLNLATAAAPNQADFVQQPTAASLADATARCERVARHFVLPTGVRVPITLPPMLDGAARAALNLPDDRPIVLSAGAIGAPQLRMEYLVTELAALPEPRPFLCLLGDEVPGGSELRALAAALLGSDNVSIRPVPSGTLGHFQRAADLMVFSKLHHRLGRGGLEAVARGTPVLAHDCTVTRELLGPYAVLRDLSRAGAATPAIRAALATPVNVDARYKRWRHVRDRYGWKALREPYVAMFERVMTAA